MTRRKTDAEFKKEVFDLVGDEYTFLEPYIKSSVKIKAKHNKCNNVYKVTPNHFLRGKRCPYCSGLIKKTDAQFKQEVKDLVGDEYTFLEHYVNNHTKLKVKHNLCGNVYEVRPNDFLTGHRCPYCAGYIKKNNISFKQEVYNLVGNEYTFLDTYINARTKLRVKHNRCNTIYKVTPNNFFTGYRCPYCSIPRGETLISKILDTLNIKHETQKTFDNLTDKASLSYDFFIPSQSILIEYQGIQHYQPVDHFGGEDRFKIQQKHDKMKLSYAKAHHYNLIAVPYTEDTFSKIKKYLIKHGLKLH